MRRYRLNVVVALLACLSLVFSIAPLPQALASAETETVTPTVINQNNKHYSSIYTTSLSQEVTFKFALNKWDGKYTSTSLSVVSDSNVEGTCNVYDGGDGYGYLMLSGRGVHKVVVKETFKSAKGTAKHYIKYNLSLNLKCVAFNLENLVSYAGMQTQLTANYVSSAVTWSSSNANVASVDENGLVTSNKRGRCYIYGKATSKATDKTVKLKLLVEVTYKGAYKAVKNAFEDYRNSKLKYSQSKRMSKNYRDCSSFVSRCYWDSSLGRKIFAIGGSDAKSWAYNAAGQAYWLYKNNKYVAKSAVSASKLLPGDTIYYETDYAGKDSSQWRYIDHAGLYVGNGKVLNTSSSGPYGCIGYRWYDYSKSDTTIKFIGRPLK